MNVDDTDSTIYRFRQALNMPVEPSQAAVPFAVEILNLSNADNYNYFSFYVLFADFFDVQHTPTGLKLALDGGADVLRSACHIIDADENLKSDVFDSYKDFSKVVTSAEFTLNFKTITETPRRTINPLIFGLSKNRREILNLEKKGNIYDLNRWERLNFLFYRSLRLAIISSFETQLSNDLAAESQIDSQIIDSTRPVFLVVKYVDLNDIQDYRPLSVKQELVNDAIIAAAKSPTEKFEKSIEKYFNLAHPLLSDQKLVRERRGSSTTEQTAQEFHIKTEANTEKSAPDTSRHLRQKTWAEIHAFEITQGASPFDLPAEETSLAEIKSRRDGLRGAALLSIPLNYRPFWDGFYLTFETIGFILAAVIDNRAETEMPTDELALCALLLCQIFYGIPIKQLIDSRFADNNDESSIAYDRGKLFIRPIGHDKASVFASKPDSNNSYFLSSSPYFQLPVPLFLKDLLNELEYRNGPSNMIFNPLETEPAAVIENYEELLKKLLIIKGLPLNILKRVSLTKISQTGAAHLRFVTPWNDDKLLSVMINGFVPREFAAQAHYVCIPKARLRKFFVDIHGNHLSIIMGESTEIFRERGMALPDLIDFGTFPRIDEDDEYVGSPFTPVAHLYSNFLKNLSSFVSRTEDTHTRHNLLTILTAIYLMTLTSLRPIEIERLNFRQVVFPSQTNKIASITVTAKANQIHDEWRPVYLPQPFHVLLQNYQTSVERIFSYVSFDDIDQPTSLFLIDQEDKICPLTSELLFEVLNKRDFCELELPEFPWKTNSPRHLYATTAFNLKIRRETIDALVGHSTRGREPLNFNSLLFNSEITNAAEKIVEEIARLLEL